MSDRPPVTLLDALPHGRVVLGIGMDLCEVPRIAAALARHGDRFLGRVFRPGEVRRRRDAPTLAEHLAGLFAAKEAAMKALGTGMKGSAFHEVCVVRAPGGPPRLALFGRASTRAASIGAHAAHVTITHTKDLAAAVVLLLGE